MAFYLDFKEVASKSVRKLPFGMIDLSHLDT